MPLVCVYAISAGMWEMWAKALCQVWATGTAVNNQGPDTVPPHIGERHRFDRVPAGR
jgi:hypothetical protein